MSALAAPLAVAVVLAAVYVLGPRLLPREPRHPHRSLSLAAGASMAYVFLDVLPELGARHLEFLDRAGDVVFAEQRIYLPALIGFIVLYGLDKMALSSHGGGNGERGDGGDEGGTPEATPISVFWLHIGGFALYGGVIGDALVGRAERGQLRLLLYAAAMVFHLLVVTSSLAREHGRRYHDRGRWVLAASVLAGWGAAALAPLPEVTMDRLFAFVAGGVLMTSASEELPHGKGGRFGWFALGAAAYGGLLLLA